MQMPTVGPEIKRLTELFSGTWRGEEKLHPSDWDPKGGAGFGTWVVHPSLDGFFLLADYTEERDGKVVYRGHGVYGWDPHAKTFTHFWFDNIGFPPKGATHGTLDGTRFQYVTAEGPQQSRMTYDWKDGKFEFTIENATDGKSWKLVHEGRYTRAR